MQAHISKSGKGFWTFNIKTFNRVENGSWIPGPDQGEASFFHENRSRSNLGLSWCRGTANFIEALTELSRP
jgi:hypothetical protein